MNENAQPNGDYEVHKAGCSHMPDSANQQDLGEHATCDTAVALAKTNNPDKVANIDGCFYCCKDCHEK